MDRVSLGDLAALAHAQLPSLTLLQLQLSAGGPGGLRPLVTAPCVACLRSLVLRFSPDVHGELSDNLYGCGLPALESLAMEVECRCKPADGAVAALGGLALPSLRRLRLYVSADTGHLVLTRTALESLLAAPGLASVLHFFNLLSTASRGASGVRPRPFDDHAFLGLAAATLPSLHSLQVTTDHYWQPAAAMLARASWVPQLTSLRLVDSCSSYPARGCGCGPALAALAGAQLPSLRTLNLWWWSKLPLDALHLMVQAPWLRGLEDLRLPSMCEEDDRALRDASPAYAELRGGGCLRTDAR